VGLHGGSEVRGDVGYGETCTLLAAVAVLVVERRLRRGVVGVAGVANSGAVVVVVAIASLAVSIFFLNLFFYFFRKRCGGRGCFGPGEAKRGSEREKNKSKRMKIMVV